MPETDGGLPFDAEAARRHLLGADPVMAAIVRAVGPFGLELRGEPFGALIRSIVHQQLAGAAARTIERRVLALFGGRYPAPAELAAADPEALRAAGLSRQKLAALLDLAAKALDGTVVLEELRSLPDEAVVEQVTRVRGIGRWTAEILLIFSLGRPDVLPVDDLGVRRAVERAYGLAGLPDAAALEGIGEAWRPYRSVAAWYLWRSLG